MTNPTRTPSVSDVEDLVDNVDPAFTLEWDSGAPGPGAGYVGVYPWGDGFVIYNDSVGGESTVYPSLRAAVVDGEAGYVTPASTEIECPSLPAADVAALLTHEGLERVQVTINGELWEAPAATEADPTPQFRAS